MTTEHDQIKATLRASIEGSLNQINPLAMSYAQPYLDWLIESAFYALDQAGFMITKRPTHPATPKPMPKVVSAAGTATGSSKV